MHLFLWQMMNNVASSVGHSHYQVSEVGELKDSIEIYFLLLSLFLCLLGPVFHFRHAS